MIESLCLKSRPVEGRLGPAEKGFGASDLMELNLMALDDTDLEPFWAEVEEI